MARRRAPSDAQGKPIDPTGIYLARQGFAIETNVIPQGERLRGDNPIVQAQGHNFVADGVPPSEWPHPELEQLVAEDAERAAAEHERLRRLYSDGKPLNPGTEQSVALTEDVVLDLGGRKIRLLAGERLPKVDFLVGQGVIDPNARGGLRLTPA